MTFSHRLNFTPEEQELFATLNFKVTQKKGNETKEVELEEFSNLYEEQRSLAKTIKKEYKYGSKNRIVDLQKAAQFDMIARDAKESEISYNKYLNTENAHWLMGWFTSIRLFLLRSNKISIAAGSRAFLPGLFAIGGFSYALTFSIDVIEVVICTFYLDRTKTEIAEGLKGRHLYMRRLGNLLDKKRLSRMANDGLWFALNLAAFILTGGIVAAINIGGFAFDLLHEVIISAFEYEKHERFLIKIRWEMERIKQEYRNNITKIQKLESEKQRLEAELKNNYEDWNNKIKNKSSIEEIRIAEKIILGNEKSLNEMISKLSELEELKAKNIENERIYKQLWTTAEKIEEKKKDAMTTRLRVVMGTTIAFFGMLLILYPPAVPLGIPLLLIGSGMALFGGSVMVGLGKRLYDLADKAVKKIKEVLKVKPAQALVAPAPEHKKVDDLALAPLEKSIGDNIESHVLSKKKDEILVGLENDSESGATSLDEINKEPSILPKPPVSKPAVSKPVLPPIKPLPRPASNPMLIPARPVSQLVFQNNPPQYNVHAFFPKNEEKNKEKNKEYSASFTAYPKYNLTQNDEVEGEFCYSAPSYSAQMPIEVPG